MKKGKAKVFLTFLVILIAGIYYYVTIPADQHSCFRFL